MATKDDCKDCVDCVDTDCEGGACSLGGNPVGNAEGAGCLFAVVAFVGLAAWLFAVAGCMTPEQASRSTNATYGDMEAKVATDIGEKANNNAVTVDIKVTIGDGAIASADSSGSTESQTQTPTFDISPKTDVRYNDALAAASTTSKGILETLTTAGANKVLALMQSGGTGEVTVQKADGTEAVVKCENGQCTTCTDCVLK